MQKITLFFVFFLYLTCGTSQSSLPQRASDSLWSIWSDLSEKDSIRSLALNRYIWEGYMFTQPDTAIQLAQLMYDFGQTKNNERIMGGAKSLQGTAHYNKGEYSLAIAHYRECLNLFRKLGYTKGVGATLSNIGNAYKDQGDYLLALNYYDSSLAIRRDNGDKTGMANTLNTLGVVYSRLGNNTKALDHYTTALKIMEENNNAAGIITSLGNIGTFFFNSGDYATALDYFTRSLRISREIGSKRHIASNLANIGGTLVNLGDYTRAIVYLFEALTMSREIKEKSLTSNCINNIGAIYTKLGQNQEALEYYYIGLQLCEEMGDKAGIALSYSNIGLVFSDQGDETKAQDYFFRGKEVYDEIGHKKGSGSILSNIAQSYMRQRKYSEALVASQDCLQIFEEIDYKMGVSQTLSVTGRIYLFQHEYEKALQYYQQSLKIALEINTPEETINATKGIYLTQAKLAHLAEAIAALSVLKRNRYRDLKTNFFTLSEEEKISYFSLMQEDFECYYDFSLYYQDSFPAITDTAYNLALLNKGLALKSTTAMRLAILESGDSSLISKYETWLAVKRNVADHYASGEDVDELEQTARELEKELIGKSTVFSDFEKMMDLDWTAVRDHLEPKEAAIEFIHFKSEIDTGQVIYAALVITQKSEHPKLIRLCLENDLKKILGTFQGNNLDFVNRVYGTRTNEQQALYQKIWQPLEPLLNDIQTVYYSPSGLLHKISFAAIPTPQKTLLSDNYHFRQMGSTCKIAFPEKTPLGTTENFMLMGGVNYNSDSTEKQVWSYLPGSLLETEAIQSFLQKKNMTVSHFSASNANEASLKEKIKSASIVHIATHGFFFPDPGQVRNEMKATEENSELTFRGTTNYANWNFVNNQNPLMRSGIVLANANDVWSRNPLAEGEDGILTALEVSTFDLRNTKLVVLSACETGLGDIKGSEGVFGLQRAFKMAGVNYLIMSLWQVPDKETSEFMQLFYKNLLQLKDIPAAFQKTQKIMRQKYDPYYWGAFVLIE